VWIGRHTPLKQNHCSWVAYDSKVTALDCVMTARRVPSGMRLEFGGGISGNMRLSFQAARSIG